LRRFLQRRKPNRNEYRHWAVECGWNSIPSRFPLESLRSRTAIFVSSFAHHIAARAESSPPVRRNQASRLERVAWRGRGPARSKSGACACGGCEREGQGDRIMIHGLRPPVQDSACCDSAYGRSRLLFTLLPAPPT
jgi:hypothetical protein